MDDDLNKFLSFEVKKEMADRYFGFRKLIEEDIQEYDDQVLASHLRLEQKIGFDLVRLYILLKDRDLIQEFFQLAGLEQMIFYDPYFAESPTIRKRVFSGQRICGWTRFNRFKNMIFDTYETLAEDINDYRDNTMKLAEERETIAEEIRLFYKKNDLGTMLDFLRSLEGEGYYKSGDMQGGIATQTGTSLENKMRVEPPPPVEQLLPTIPPITPLKNIKDRLRNIIERAYKKQQELDVRDIV